MSVTNSVNNFKYPLYPERTPFYPEQNSTKLHFANTGYNAPKTVNTFGGGLKVWRDQFLNDMSYAGSWLNKQAMGEEHLKDAITTLQNEFNGKLVEQPTDVLQAKIKYLDNESYKIPYPTMSPTHSISLSTPRNTMALVQRNIIEDIISRRESGASTEENNAWLNNLYQNGSEASERHRKVLEEAEKIPRTEGWGTVGNVTGSILEGVASIAGAGVNAGLGLALSGLTIGKALVQGAAQANKEMDIYEKNTNTKISPAIRKGYVSGITATDFLLGGLMQSRYLKSIDLPGISSLRKRLFNQLLKKPGAMSEFNNLFRNTMKGSGPTIFSNAGRLSLEQAGASTASGLSRNMFSMLYKNPQDYPTLSTVFNEALTNAAIGGATGFITGGVSSGIGTLTRPRTSKLTVPYQLKFPDEKPLFDLDGLSLSAYNERDKKIRQVFKENYKPNASANDGNGTPIQFPDETPLFDVGNMSLNEYNRLRAQLREGLRDYYMRKPQNEGQYSPEMRANEDSYQLTLPNEAPLFDLDGLSLKEWTEREKVIKSILGENYTPRITKEMLEGGYELNLPNEKPMFDLDGLSLKAYNDRENKIKQILKENYRPNASANDGNGTPIQFPDETPLFDIGNMSLNEYNRLRAQLREGLRDYYMRKPQNEGQYSPEMRANEDSYQLTLPDEAPLFDLDGLSLKEWTEREKIIKSILGENYMPRNFNTKNNNSQDAIWQNSAPNDAYTFSIKRSIIDDLGGKLNLKTRVFADIRSIPQEYKKFLDDHSRSKGFYNPETDEVVIIGNNIESEADLHNTLIQKGYAPKGLEGIVGKELDNLLDDIYGNMSIRESRKYSNKGESSKGSALAYISDLAQNPSLNPSEWNRLSSYIREIFKTKYNVQNISDDTIKELIWKTGKQISGDDSIEEMIRKSAK